MHLTTITTRKGKEYVGYIDKIHLKKGNKVAYVNLLLARGEIKKIYIYNIKSATTEHERISVEQLDATMDNLKEWKQIIEKWG